MRVNAVHLEGFRGATKRVTVKFDPKKSVTVLFGENGAGKSTVIDAIDFASNQSFGSLEGKSLGGEKKHAHIGSLNNATKASPSVDLDTDLGTLSARLASDKIVVTEKPAGIVRPLVSVLRRSQVLRLIDAKPAERFEELRGFFSTPTWTLAESTLRQALKAKQEQYTFQATRLEQALSTLETLWQQHGMPGGSSDEWGESVLAVPDAAAASRIANIKLLGDAMGRFSRAATKHADAQRQWRDAEVAADDARKDAKAAQLADAGNSLELLQLLEQAKTFVDEHPVGATCPVCEQAKDAVELRNELEGRIASLLAVSKARDLIQGLATVAQTKGANFGASKDSLLERFVDIADSASSLGVEDAWLDELKTFIAALSGLGLLPEALQDQLDSLTKGLQSLRDEVTRSEEAKSLRDSVRLQTDAIGSARLKATELEAVTGRLRCWLLEIEAARKEVLDAELSSMSLEVSALYERIHPDEGKSLFSFSMKPTAVSSLDFEADFLGHSSLPVQAYFSESHLDTLGLCIFLAVAQRKSGKAAVIVLDDVLTSVDATHLDRVMGVIDDVAQKVSQVIVATHYRLWRDKYRWGRAPLSQTEVIEFGPWSLTTGIQVQAFQDALAELTGLLKAAPLDRQVVASKAGIVLESMLDFLTLKFACAMPRNARAEYTLGALADGIDKKLAGVLRTEFQDPKSGATRSHELRPLISAATTAQWVRNAVGCHFNSLDSQIPDSDVLQFANAVIEFAQAMICNVCRTMTTNDKTGSNWQCRCGALKLWPLARPKD